MRSLPLLLVFFLSGTSAYADSSCAPLANAFHLLAKAPNFTHYKVQRNDPSQRTLVEQGRPDGIYIYSPKTEEGKKPSFEKGEGRDEFAERNDRKAEKMLSGELSGEYRCDELGEETINGKAMTVYAIIGKDDDKDRKDRTWIGKDDGLFHQIISGKTTYILVYGPQE